MRWHHQPRMEPSPQGLLHGCGIITDLVLLTWALSSLPLISFVTQKQEHLKHVHFVLSVLTEYGSYSLCICE